MRCILVFDHLNDVVFSKCDRKFVDHIKKLGSFQGLDSSGVEIWVKQRMTEYKEYFALSDSEVLKLDNMKIGWFVANSAVDFGFLLRTLNVEKPFQLDGVDKVDVNFVVQLFSPIVTSQRIMSSQFGNSYTSIQCQDGLNVVFDEYLGYLFVNLGFQDISWMKRVLAVSISIIQHVCGPDVSTLKAGANRNTLVGRLLDTWGCLVNEDQGILLEAIEQLSVNSELSLVAVKALKGATEKMKSMLDQPKSHALIFVKTKFLALYSSKSVRPLTSSDLLFLGLLSVLSQKDGKQRHSCSEGSRSVDSNCSEFYSFDASPASYVENGPIVDSSGSLSDLILLSADKQLAASPYIIHILALAEDVTLILLYQTPYEALSISLTETFDALYAINVISMSNSEIDGMKNGVESLEIAGKKVFDALKKLRGSESNSKIEDNSKILYNKWEAFEKHWADYSVGSTTSTGILSCCQNLSSSFKDLLRLTVMNKSGIAGSQASAHLIKQKVSSSLTHFKSFLQVKAQNNFTLGSKDNLNVGKYLEGFPGLVHFIYVDRVNHRLIAPSWTNSIDLAPSLTKEKSLCEGYGNLQVWSMVDLSRSHLQEGHLAIMWKDQSFSYAYYLWFEDSSGSPLQPKVKVSMAIKMLPFPGVISSNFYSRLVKLCFPRMTLSKIRCYELYCIHLGGATSSTVLEQSHRLATTICELSGVPSDPLDIL